MNTQISSACKFLNKIDRMQNLEENLAYASNANFPFILPTNSRHQIISFYLFLINCNNYISNREWRLFFNFSETRMLLFQEVLNKIKIIYLEASSSHARKENFIFHKQEKKHLLPFEELIISSFYQHKLFVILIGKRTF